MNNSSTEKLFAIIAELQSAKISFSLVITREDAITILAVVPGQRWEIDIFLNGEVWFEVFRSQGDILTEQQLIETIRREGKGEGEEKGTF